MIRKYLAICLASFSITDKQSVPIIKNVVKGQIGKYLSESVIQNPDIRFKNAKDDNNFPKLRVEFVDIDIILISLMQTN